MGRTTKPTRHNRTITVDFHAESTYFQLLSDGKAFVGICPRLYSLDRLPAYPQGALYRRWVSDPSSHYARVRLGGLTVWRIQCTSCKAVFTVLPHFVLRYRRMSPEIAQQALVATTAASA